LIRNRYGGRSDIVFHKRVYRLQREAEHSLHLMLSVWMCSYMRTLSSRADKEYRNYRFKTDVINIHLSLHHIVLQRVHSLFQSEFSRECDVVLPLSISNVFSLREGHPVAAYVFFLVFPFPSILLLRTCLEGSSYAICDHFS